MFELKKTRKAFMTCALAISTVLAAAAPAAAAAGDAAAASPPSAAAMTVPAVVSDTDITAQLGILQGEGNGLDAAYLGKSTTRIQAAILFLRLKGFEAEALAFTANRAGNFADASLVWQGGQSVLAYLKANPQLGWVGVDDSHFDPLSGITSQQVYKVILEALGYKQDVDFTYADTLKTAASAGLGKAASAKPFKNVNMATVIVEALGAQIKGAGQTLAALLTEKKVVTADQLKPLQYKALNMATQPELGTFLTDDKDMTLYYFSKDAANPNACQGKCLENWPIYYSETLRIPAGLESEDFGTLTRADGKKQTTYKGWPLYYFVGDTAAGMTKGEAVNKVWFVVEAPAFAAIAQKDGLGSYLTDSYGRTLYYFDKDTQGVSVCSGQCEANWPVYYEDNIQAPTGTKQSDFSYLVRTDGSKQTTYKGFPLYYFAKDKQRGDTMGQNVNSVWYAVYADSFAGTKAVNYSIKTTSSADGKKILVDSKGMALYTFTKDLNDVNSCQGKCLEAWPIFHADPMTLSPDLNKDDFGMIMRTDGTMQTTYKGWPLYYYFKDIVPGQMTGQKVGNVWFLAGPELTSPRQKPEPEPAAPAMGGEYSMEMSGFAFSTLELTVEAGSKVTFTNKDSAKHNAVAVDGSFSTPLLAKGETATITLDKPGVYEYYCEPHKEFMRAKIIVK